MKCLLQTLHHHPHPQKTKDPRTHLKTITGPLLGPLQFAYRANRSVDDAVNLALHYILQHLDSAGTYTRILFVDFSSAFNTIIPALPQDKLSQLSVPDPTCRLRSFPSALLPVYQQLHLQSPVCQAAEVHRQHTTLIELISGGEESAYRWEIDHLVIWCGLNNLELSAVKTVEMVVDFRRNAAPRTPHYPV
ncbi:hypothetical protein N1851_034264 [Merluccius polli]|uniref:Reverse transcriptase domain-containing protein n=1 Tax=Merluccius polli TaxID=89951 RepID=A0AA47M002_MERPO|nr:hypothetical protein N1851_034264 [Merluccius polli]